MQVGVTRTPVDSKILKVSIYIFFSVLYTPEAFNPLTNPVTFAGAYSRALTRVIPTQVRTALISHLVSLKKKKIYIGLGLN